MAEDRDTEITLGTGRLLGIFFGLVIVCAVFFGLGFSLGRNSVKTAGLTMEETPSTAGISGPGGTKASPGTPEKPLVVKDAAAANDAGATPEASGPAPVVSTPSTASSSPAAPPETSQPVASGAYILQVAAVSKEEDAEALVSALKKKSYPVFVAPNQSSDKLFHVQIGPFGDIKEAEAMKLRLTGDGYNPILKR